MATLFIPAKGNSKRIPRKNLCLIQGKSLLQRAIEDAKRWNIIEEIYVATDEPEIFEFATIMNCKTYDITPKDANDQRTVRNLWKEFCINRTGDQIVWHLTNPFRKKSELDAAWKAYKDNDLDILFSVKAERHLIFDHNHKPLVVNPMESMTRLTQHCSPYYVLDGSFTFAKANYIVDSLYFEQGKMDIFPLNTISTIEIDYPEDLTIACGVASQLGDYWNSL